MDRKISGMTEIVGDPDQRMQRVRVGVTGLAAIILVALLATAIASGLNRRAAQTVTPSRPEVVSTLNVTDEKSEPLAQLGVAPDTKEAKPDPKAAKR